jgi:hypothetical protein
MMPRGNQGGLRSIIANLSIKKDARGGFCGGPHHGIPGAVETDEGRSAGGAVMGEIPEMPGASRVAGFFDELIDRSRVLPVIVF